MRVRYGTYWALTQHVKKTLPIEVSDRRHHLALQLYLQNFVATMMRSFITFLGLSLLSYTANAYGMLVDIGQDQMQWQVFLCCDLSDVNMSRFRDIGPGWWKCALMTIDRLAVTSMRPLLPSLEGISWDLWKVKSIANEYLAAFLFCYPRLFQMPPLLYRIAPSFVPKSHGVVSPLSKDAIVSQVYSSKRNNNRGSRSSASIKMMPIGVPKVAYRVPGSQQADW